MLQQLITVNRFVSLAPDDPDNSDTDTEPTEPRTADKPHDDVSAVSDDTIYYEANDDTPYFQAGGEPPHVRSGKLQSLLTSEMSMECYNSVINLTQPSALSRKLKLHWAWMTHSRCGSGQMLALARCHVRPLCILD